jgi:4'-phosphopantetheinyl transferase EntD
MDSVRLARMEERQIAANRLQEDFIAEQRIANQAFWETKNKVDKMQAKGGAIVWILGLFGSLTVSFAVAAAWIFEQRHAIMAWLKGGS